ncbi:MAG TPA: thiamine diphosphokinase [Candidatus Limnocylindrales bacterium]|nr:thiamine diphosphokinase [Candidatus Limnocylindrales bacterium]
MTPRHVLVLADGPVDEIEAIDEAWPGWSEGIDHVIAADGGARHAAGLRRTIDHWLGDADSIDPSLLATLQAEGVRVDRAPVDKDETDAELALIAAAATGSRRITILGALGGSRLDHELGNVWLLAHAALADRDARLVSARTRIRLATAAGRGSAGPTGTAAPTGSPGSAGPTGTAAPPGTPGSAASPRRSGPIDVGGRMGDLVSLLPFGGDAEGITTDGLRYPLRDESLRLGPSRGLSNVREAEDATVTLRSGRLLVVETPARLPE